MATKQELLKAIETRYPRKEGEKGRAYITRLKEQEQPRLDRQRAKKQAQLDAIPELAIDFLKAEALEMLAEQAQTDYKEANKDSELA